MAEGAPPNKRPKTDGGIFASLEDELPDELMTSSSGIMPTNNGFGLATSQSTNNATQQNAGAPSVMSPNPVPNSALQNMQQHKKLSHYIQQSHNSPKHARTSPSSNNSPRPPLNHPQPSPLSTVQNSMQSPTAGSIAGVMNSMKSPPSSLPRPNSRPSSAVSATPSPRSVPVPGGTMNSAALNNSTIVGVPNTMRNSIGLNQMNPQNINSHGMVPSPQIIANGPSRTIQGIPNNNFQNDISMQMQGGGMMNSQPGTYPGQPRMQPQVNPMHSINSSMNAFGQQPNSGNMQDGLQQGLQRPMQVNPGQFNDVSMTRPTSMGMMTLSQDGSMQNLINDNSMPVSMDGGSMMRQPSTNMGMIGMDKANAGMQMKGMRPVMAQGQPGMPRIPNSQVQDGMVNISQDSLQTHMQSQVSAMQPQNHLGVGSLPQDPMQMQMKNSSGTHSAGAPADPEKRRLIQQQLVLLLHAYKCAKKEQNGDQTNCPLPHCRTMKEVLNHMNVCSQGKSCQVAHCASSRQIIAHWRACTRHDCVVCLPLKSVPNNTNTSSANAVQMQQRWLNNPVSQMGESSVSTVASQGVGGPGMSGAPPLYSSNFNDTTSMLNPSNSIHPNSANVPDCLSGLTNGLGSNQVGGNLGMGPGLDGNLFHPPRVEREWHKDVKEELRNHLVQKLVQAIFPSPQKVSLTDERMKKLVTFARKVEGDMYEQANSRSEYYHLLAEKIYKIQKELEEKRASRMKGRPGPRMPTANGPVGLNHPMMPVQNNPNAGLLPGTGGMPGNMNGPRPHGISRFNTPMTSSTGPVMPHNIVDGGQRSQAEYMSQMIYKFKQANEEIKRMDEKMVNNQAPGMQNMSHFNQSNSGQDSNSLNNAMIDGFNQQQDIKPNITPNSVDSIMSGQRSLDPLSQSSMDSVHSNQMTQNARPQLAKLLQEDMPSSSVSSSFLSNNNNQFFQPDPSKNLISQQKLYQSGGDSQPQHPTSLQEILQGGTSTASSSSSFVSASQISSSNSISQSPSPFVSKPQAMANSDIKDPNIINKNNSVNSSGGFPQQSIVKSEPGGKGGKGMENSDFTPTVKTEPPPDQGFGSRGKPWSSPVSSTVSAVKTEVKMEKNDQFGNTSSPANASGGHDPFVKQESMANDSSISQKGKASRVKVFDPLELKQALMPVVEKLYKQEPEAIPFRQPVDPERLCIPDYFDIVKKPMDLATISKNLDTGKYKEPWEFIAHIWLMFNNAWLYNRRTTRVYKYCSRLKEIFEAEINPVMQSLGYCCGRKMEFMPMTLCCYGKQLCTIPTGAVYFNYQNRYDYCEKCFNDIQGDSISLADDSSKPQSNFTTIPKSQFEKRKNDVLDPEPFEICSECDRKMHKICVLHMSPIWPEGFTCDECLSKRGAKRKPNRYLATKLPQNKLSEHIEKRVNNYITRHDTSGEAGHVHIRVVYSGDKTVEVRPGMKAKFVDTKEMPETYPYRAKAFFAFEEIDGVDVCFFGVHVQEYGSDAPKPNQRRVYLSYLDSVHFFRPRHLRTAVYHEILIGYFEFCKNLGYEFAHIWACPPCEGDDYIFHCHPVEQKIPKPKRLQDWYKKMLDKAISEQVIVDYKDIFHQAKEDRLQSARELPYFEGDFWPNVLEESIKEIEQEEEDRKQAEASEQAAAEEALLFKFSPLQSQSDQGASCNSKNGKNKKSKKATIKKTSQRTSKKKLPQVMNDLSDKLYQIMEKHKEVFFVIRLHSVETINKMGPTVDPDPPMQCDLMDGRDAFLTLARDKHYEFSSLRRAKWSTMAMLIELHTNGQDKFTYMCNRCKNNVETRYQCTVCHDFDLCVNCYKQVGHEHKMDKMGLGLDDGTGSPGSGANTKSSTLPVERCMQSLVHACQCKNANCNMPACYKMKKVVHHAKMCKKKTSGTCVICKQLIALCCYHAKHCQEKKCSVAFCANIRNKLKQQEVQQRMQQAILMKRRMMVMSRNTSAQAGPHTPANATPQAQNQSSPSISEVHMRKPQPSPMKGKQEASQQMRAAQTMSRPMSAQQPMLTQTPGMTSPHMNTGQQQFNDPGVMNQGQHTPQMPQGNILSPGQPLQPGMNAGFARRHPSPPPEAAVRAAKQAQQLADQQAKESKKMSTFVHSPMPNQNQMSNRPMTSMTRPIGPNWGQVQNRPPLSMKMTGHPQQSIIGNSLQQPSSASNNNQTLKRILELLKTDANQGGIGAGERVGSQQLITLLKADPQLMSSIIKQRKAINQANQAQQPQQQNSHFIQQPNMTSIGSAQQPPMSNVGVQQVAMQSSINQPGINMPVQVNNMQPMHWQQQQQQQQRRMQLQHQQSQGQFQTPAPPYPQQTRLMNVRFLQHGMQTPQARHQQVMNPNVVMQQGMNPAMSNMQQGMQQPMQHHPGPRPSSQQMQSGRLPQMSPHAMVGRTTPLNQTQGTVPQHMVPTMDQQQYSTVNTPQQAMMGGGYSHQGVSQGISFNNAAGTGFANNVNQDLSHLTNAAPGQDGLERFVKKTDK